MQGQMPAWQAETISDLKKELSGSPKMVNILVNHTSQLLEAIVGKLVAVLGDGTVCNGSVLVKIEAIKLLQDLSIIASSGYEAIFKTVVDCIVASVLPKREQQFFAQTNSDSLAQMLVLQEHAVTTLGNLIFDSPQLFTAAISHKMVVGTDSSSRFSVVKLIIDLIHFKRSQLTFACLWTLNNLMNYHS